MAAQEMPQPRGFNTEAARQAREAARRRKLMRLVESGEFVPNAPLREYVERMRARDPEFSLVTVCFRLADLGYPKFVRKPSGAQRSRKLSGDVTHLMRVLGMRDLAPSLHGGRRIPAKSRTSHIPYDLAVALARALDMDPVDAGV